MQNNSTSKRSFLRFNLFSVLFASMLAKSAGMDEFKPMFKGANLSYQNPIYIPNKSRKLKGYQKSLATRSFNKNR